MHPRLYMERSAKRYTVTIILWLLLVLSFLGEISTMSKVLNRMLTTGDELPLQSFLNQFTILWEVTDSILSFLLTPSVYKLLYFQYVWGGFTYMLILKNVINYLHNPDQVRLDREQALGRGLSLIFAFIMLLSIIYGLDRDNWVPYVQQPTWMINMVYKQQVSAGTYLMVFLFIYFHGVLPNSRGHTGSLEFYSRPGLMTLVFSIFMLDNLGSYDWFVEGWGYEEIFRYGQTAYSFDKVYHFTASVALTIILMMYIKQTRLVIGTAIGFVFGWELFEISLNPLESSDSLLDMMFNSTAIILTAFIYSKGEKRMSVTTHSSNDDYEDRNQKIARL